MSIENFLNNFGNRNKRGGDRGSNYRYSDDNSQGAPAIDVKGVSLLGVQLVETGTYNPEFLRPYVVSASDADLNAIADVVDSEGGIINSGTLSGLSGRVMQYANRVDERDLIEIEGGWDERRFSFIIEVVERQRDEEDMDMGREVVTYLSGYTDCFDIAQRNFTRHGRNNNQEILLAPETEFFVTNLRRIERDSRIVLANNQLIIPSYYRDQSHRRDNTGLYTLRPRDVFNKESIQHREYRGGDRGDSIIIDATNELRGAIPTASRAANLNSATYLSSSINALTQAEGQASTRRDMFGNLRGNSNSRADVYGRAKSFIREDHAYEPNSFLALIRQSTSFQNDQTFTWEELQKLFGTDGLENLTKIHAFDRVERDSRVSLREDSAHWDERENSGTNAVIATVLKQSLPAYAMESLIYACRIEAVNALSRSERMDAIDGIRVVVSDVVFAAKFDTRTQEQLIRDFENAIAIDIMKDLSLNNEIIFDIVVDLDWRFDSFYHVGVDGDEPIMFSAAGFSSSLTSPIISADASTAELIGRDLRSIVANILGK